MNPWRKKLITEWAELSVSWFCHSLRSIHLGWFGMASDDTMRAWASADSGLRCAGLAWGIIDADRPAKLYRELPMPPARALCPVAELAELDAQSFDETDESIIKRTRSK